MPDRNLTETMMKAAAETAKRIPPPVDEFDLARESYLRSGIPALISTLQSHVNDLSVKEYRDPYTSSFRLMLKLPDKHLEIMFEGDDPYIKIYSTMVPDSRLNTRYMANINKDMDNIAACLGGFFAHELAPKSSKPELRDLR